MKNLKKQLVLASGIALCIGLTACSPKPVSPSTQYAYHVHCISSTINYCVDSACTKTVAATGNISVVCNPSMPTKVIDTIKNSTTMPVDVTVTAPNGNTTIITKFNITQKN